MPSALTTAGGCHSNHRSSPDVVGLFEYVAAVAPGYSGLLHVRDDEDPGHENQVRVLRLARGTITWHGGAAADAVPGGLIPRWTAAARTPYFSGIRASTAINGHCRRPSGDGSNAVRIKASWLQAPSRTRPHDTVRHRSGGGPHLVPVALSRC
ncbi:Imm7 family immunity protein [Streptomyces sp. NPDC088747]|uniref:Imm7 family immunity protein n=1 Tax=Streptomyces sp. NPDC088747 TaxID=3365886 RepID=UPI0038234D54